MSEYSDLIELSVELLIELYSPIAALVFIFVICHLIFQDRLRRSALIIALEMFFLFLVLILAGLYLSYSDASNGWFLSIAALFLLIFLYNYTKTVRDGLQKLLFVFGAAFHAASCLMLLSDMLDVAFNVQKYFPITVLINIAAYTLGGWAVYCWFAPLVRKIDSRDMKWLLIVPVMFYVISEFLPFVHIDTGVIDAAHMSLFLIYLISSLAVCVLLLRILAGVVKNTRLEAEAEAINRQLAMQREQYARLMKNMETVKFMQHDMRHHLTLIEELGQGVAKLEEYIQSVSEKLSDTDEKFFCTNFAVNTVAAHYLGMAENEGASVEARLEIPEETGFVQAMDLCVIMGNLLENAVEACRRLKDGNKFIRVRARIEGDSLSIVVVNSFDGLWLECGKDGVYLSRKTNEGEPEREGVGLSSVKAVCEKYRGLVQYEITNDVWKSSALVHM